MKVRLYSKALRKRYGADSVDDAVEVPDDEARAYFDAGVAAPVRSSGDVETAQAPAAEERGGWDLQMDPEEYLERYPDGPNAEAAKAALEG